MIKPDPAELRRIAILCRNAEGPDRTIDVLAWVQIGWTEGGDEQIAWRRMLPLDPASISNGSDMVTALLHYPHDHRGIARSWNVPQLTLTRDASASILGREEDPFVLLAQSDFGGLRRARVYDGDGISTTADAATVPLATLAAGLEALAMRVEGGLPLPTRS